MSYPDPGPLPERFVHMPGFVDDYAQWIMDTAPYPNRVLAFSASLAFLSFITGRSVKDERGNHTNLYYIALANPGTGKDRPRKCNGLLAMENQLQSCLADGFGSGEGLEDSLYIQPTMLYQVDEFDTLFNSLRQAKDGRGESIIEKMLKLSAPQTACTGLATWLFGARTGTTWTKPGSRRPADASPTPIWSYSALLSRSSSIRPSRPAC